MTGMKRARSVLSLILVLAIVLELGSVSWTARAAADDVIFSDSCDSLTAAGYGTFYPGTVGTESAQANVLSADSAEKYGKTVPEGEYYLYSDADTAVGTSKMMWKDLGSITQAFSLTFDAQFLSLPAATTGYHLYNTRRGLVVQVTPEQNGVFTRVGFNNLTPDSVDVYITKRNAHSIPTVYSEDYNEVFRTTVPLTNPTDTHTWKIANDGLGNVAVYLDGALVASQSDVTVKGWGSDINQGLQFGIRMDNNLASPADSTEAEILLDNIVLKEEEFDPGLTDEEAVAGTYALLDFAHIRGFSTGAAGYVTGDLDLITSDSENGTSISWSSSNEDILSNTGVLTKPSVDTTVTLTATITKNAVQTTKGITVTALADWAMPLPPAVTADTVYFNNMDALGDYVWVRQYTHSKAFGTILASESSAAYHTAVRTGEVVAFTHEGGDRTRRFMAIEPDTQAFEIGVDLKFLELAEATSPYAQNNAQRGFLVNYTKDDRMFLFGFHNLNLTAKTVDISILQSTPTLPT